MLHMGWSIEFGVKLAGLDPLNNVTFLFQALTLSKERSW